MSKPIRHSLHGRNTPAHYPSNGPTRVSRYNREAGFRMALPPGALSKDEMAKLMGMTLHIDKVDPRFKKFHYYKVNRGMFNDFLDEIGHWRVTTKNLDGPR